MVKHGNTLANFLTSFLGPIIPLMVKAYLDYGSRANNENTEAPTLEQRQGVGAIVEGVGLSQS